MIIELSFDDGAKKDLKVLELLLKYGLADKATFYIPTYSELSDDEILRIAYYSKVGGHTVHHPSDLKLLSTPVLEKEIGANRKFLMDLTGQKVESFCYPRGRYDKRVKDMVRGIGFKEARTTKVLCTEVGEDLYEKHTTLHLYPRTEYGTENWFDLALRLLETEPEYFHVWGHSWEMKAEDWFWFEELLKILSKQK